MPNIFKRGFVEARGFGVRAGVVACILLLAAATTAGISRVIAAKARSPDHVVSITDMTFSPAVLAVRIGDRVEFRNTDLVPHTATARTAGAFDSGLVKPGGSWIFVPQQEGTFSYTCTFHPMMRGEVTVAKR